MAHWHNTSGEVPFGKGFEKRTTLAKCSIDRLYKEQVCVKKAEELYEEARRARGGPQPARQSGERSEGTRTCNRMMGEPEGGPICGGAETEEPRLSACRRRQSLPSPTTCAGARVCCDRHIRLGRPSGDAMGRSPSRARGDWPSRRRLPDGRCPPPQLSPRVFCRGCSRPDVSEATGTAVADDMTAMTPALVASPKSVIIDIDRIVDA